MIWFFAHTWEWTMYSWTKLLEILIKSTNRRLAEVKVAETIKSYAQRYEESQRALINSTFLTFS